MSDDEPPTDYTPDTLTPITRLTRDLRNASVTLGDDEARFLVDAYYQMQDNRISADGQIRSIDKSETPEPHAVLSWLSDQNATLEKQIRSALDRYAQAHIVGPWLYSICGIGPVISAGLIAHIDITKAPTVGHIWRFAGLDPTTSWEKGQKRPWNATLKTLCWKIGESFIKVSGNENDIFGGVYKRRKEMEIANNEAGKFAEQAAAVLAKKKIGKTTDAYKAYSVGKLPPAHIHARARRYAVKLFLSCLHSVWYFQHFGVLPPKPYAISILGHAHLFWPPNYELVPGMREALEAQGPETQLS